MSFQRAMFRHLLSLSFICFASVPLQGCTKIEDTWQYRSVERARQKINDRVRVAVLAGLAHARAEGKTDVPADDTVPAVLFGTDKNLDPLVEQYGLDENGALRGEGPALDMLVSELEIHQKSLRDEKSKPEYLISDLL